MDGCWRERKWDIKKRNGDNNIKLNEIIKLNKKKVFLCNEKGALGVWEIGIKDVK